MKILFVRHAKAFKREEWHDDDMLRPLSEKGIKVSEDFFEKISHIFEIEIILSSKALRSIQTAKIIHKYYPKAIYQTTPLLNPGASYTDLKTLIKEYENYENIALVGHEPDISEIVGELLGCSFLSIDVKKSSIIECEGINLEEMELKSFLYPKLLKRLNI